MLLSRSQYQSLPQEPGVYLFLNKKRKIIYIGKAKNLKNRVSSYFVNKNSLGYRTKLLFSEIDKIKVIIVSSEIESLLLEANLIKKYKPFYNVKLTDGKAYPLIRITRKDKYPKVLISRRTDDPNSLYFGPYPNTGAMHLVLRTIRRIFPFQSVVNHPKKPCLYYHLGLCPCPQVFGDRGYRKNINHISHFLKGNIAKIIFDLEKERDKFSEKEQYEKARRVQEKIEAIKQITLFTSNPFEYEENPNLREDLKQKEMSELLTALVKNNVSILSLNKIECFDVSNTAGDQAVGSMDVFLKAEKIPSLYKKFKIKGNFRKQNDCAMMEEIITRRLKHKEWPLPDLIVVDGGKGQVSAAVKALKKDNLVISVVGLAKKEEIIITEDFKRIRLSRNSPALNLIMRIRDEAHRFALSYHKKLRSQAIFS